MCWNTLTRPLHGAISMFRAEELANTTLLNLVRSIDHDAKLSFSILCSMLLLKHGPSIVVQTPIDDQRGEEGKKTEKNRPMLLNPQSCIHVNTIAKRHHEKVTVSTDNKTPNPTSTMPWTPFHSPQPPSLHSHSVCSSTPLCNT